LLGKRPAAVTHQCRLRVHEVADRTPLRRHDLCVARGEQGIPVNRRAAISCGHHGARRSSTSPVGTLRKTAASSAPAATSCSTATTSSRASSAACRARGRRGRCGRRAAHKLGDHRHSRAAHLEPGIVRRVSNSATTAPDVQRSATTTTREALALLGLASGLGGHRAGLHIASRIRLHVERLHPDRAPAGVGKLLVPVGPD
jgi:hypothetical protein